MNLLIDGHNFLNKVYFRILKQNYKNDLNKIQSLEKFKKEVIFEFLFEVYSNVSFFKNVDKVFVCFDGRSWRKSLGLHYKENREEKRKEWSEKEKELKNILFSQVNTFLNEFKDLDLNFLFHGRAEADDLIFSLTFFLKNEFNVIISSDSDFTQLLKNSSKSWNVLFNGNFSNSKFVLHNSLQDFNFKEYHKNFKKEFLKKIINDDENNKNEILFDDFKIDSPEKILEFSKMSQIEQKNKKKFEFSVDDKYVLSEIFLNSFVEYQNPKLFIVKKVLFGDEKDNVFGVVDETKETLKLVEDFVLYDFNIKTKKEFYQKAWDKFQNYLKNKNWNFEDFEKLVENNMTLLVLSEKTIPLEILNFVKFNLNSYKKILNKKMDVEKLKNILKLRGYEIKDDFSDEMKSGVSKIFKNLD